MSCYFLRLKNRLRSEDLCFVSQLAQNRGNCGVIGVSCGGHLHFLCKICAIPTSSLTAKNGNLHIQGDPAKFTHNSLFKITAAAKSHGI